jgi:hypothetical protein
MVIVITCATEEEIKAVMDNEWKLSNGNSDFFKILIKMQREITAIRNALKTPEPSLLYNGDNQLLIGTKNG